MLKKTSVLLFFLMFALSICAFGQAVEHDSPDPGLFGPSDALPWWGWALILFGFTLVLGIVAVIAGVGGGTLFVPIVSAFFPFHFDFIRGTGLMVALCGAVAAGPKLLKEGLASIRLGMPLAIISSVCAVFGAQVGLALPDRLVQTMLGFAVVIVVALMVTVKKTEFPEIKGRDKVADLFGIRGVYYEKTLDRDIEWTVHRTLPGMLLFIVIGFMAGMFGIGAGWASVPALNILMGAPIKIAIATSGFIITINAPAGAWVYLNAGAVLPMIAIPSVAGMMIGTTLGARMLPNLRPKFARWIVIGILLLTGIRYILKGFSLWG
jgi:uncharacterized membrane protein YfcA